MPTPEPQILRLSYFEQRYGELIARINADDIDQPTILASVAMLGLGVEIIRTKTLQNIETQLGRIDTALRG